MPTNLAAVVAKKESRTLELKRSTGELREAMQTHCAFANGAGGRVLIGVKAGWFGRRSAAERSNRARDRPSP